VVLKVILTCYFLITLMFSFLKDIGIGIVPSYFDEGICLLALMFLIYKQSIQLVYFRYFLVFFVINCLNAFLSYLNFEFIRFFLDFYLFLKPIIFLLFLSCLSPRLFSKIYFFVLNFSRIYLVTAFLCLPIHYIFLPFGFDDQRFGLYAYRFIASNAGDLTNMLLVTTLISSSSNAKKSSAIYTIIGIILLMSTLRFKAFVIVLAYLILLNRNVIKFLFNWIKSKAERKTLFSFGNFLVVFPFAVLIVLPGYSQFVTYFLSDNMTPRFLLTIEGFNIFIKNFPFGVGPGFYGSAASSLFYSPIYVDLGWVNYYGLGPNSEVNFLNDSFWPMVIAQYGFIGLIVVLLMYRNFIYSYLSFNTIHSFRYSIITVVSLLLSTLGSSIFIGHIGLFYILGRFVLEHQAIRFKNLIG
jgi:hypothetical protein